MPLSHMTHETKLSICCTMECDNKLYKVMKILKHQLTYASNKLLTATLTQQCDTSDQVQNTSFQKSWHVELIGSRTHSSP